MALATVAMTLALCAIPAQAFVAHAPLSARLPLSRLGPAVLRPPAALEVRRGREGGKLAMCGGMHGLMNTAALIGASLPDTPLTTNLGVSEARCIPVREGSEFEGRVPGGREGQGAGHAQGLVEGHDREAERDGLDVARSDGGIRREEQVALRQALLGALLVHVVGEGVVRQEEVAALPVVAALHGPLDQEATLHPLGEIGLHSGSGGARLVTLEGES